MHSTRTLLRFCLLLLALCAGPALRAAVQPVEPEHFLPQLTAQLAGHFAVSGELQLDLLRNWSAPATPKAPWEMVVVAPPRALASQMIVHVRLTAGGRSLGEWNLPVRAQLWDDGLVARAPIARDQALDTSLFELRRTDFVRDKDAVPFRTELASLTVARGVGAGALLTWRDVTRRALVQRGNRIEVLATDGALSVTMKALAMQSGALGDTIVVRNQESRRDFSAVVVAENQVRVSF